MSDFFRDRSITGMRLQVECPFFFTALRNRCIILIAVNSSVINIHPEILGGTRVFRGTRVPIESLFDHLEEGVSLNEFLDDFPSVTREQAIKVVALAEEV